MSSIYIYPEKGIVRTDIKYSFDKIWTGAEQCLSNLISKINGLLNICKGTLLMSFEQVHQPPRQFYPC